MHLLLSSIRWAVGVPAFLLFALCFVGNWAGVVGSAFQTAHSGRARSLSLVLPFVGPALGVLSLATIPLPGLVRWCWVPVVADPIAVLGAWTLLAAVITRFSGRAGA